MGFRERLYRLMLGRYGVDELFFVICLTAVVLSFVNTFVRSVLLQLIVYALIAVALFRVFSKNLPARRKENKALVNLSNKFKARKSERDRRKTDFRHVYKKCPSCKAVLRLPRKKGKHKTVCPRCGKEFTVIVLKEY